MPSSEAILPRGSPQRHSLLLRRAQQGAQNVFSTHLDTQSIGQGTSYNLEHECGAGGCQQAAGGRLLKYVLAQHIEAGLVERVDDWPGANAAGVLAWGEVLEGTWFNRTKEWHARRRNESFAKYDYATTYEIELQPLPCFRHLPPEEYREMIADLIREIEEEGAAARKERSFPVLGAQRIRAEHPHKVVGGGRLSAAPVLFAASRDTRVSMRLDYKAFVEAYQSAS